MIELDAATLLVGWAASGWGWFYLTSRRREVGLGYGWLMRPILIALAAGALVISYAQGQDPDGWAETARDIATVAMLVVGLWALIASVLQRSAGVEQQRIELDLYTVALGAVAVMWGALAASGPTGLAVARTLMGALFVGAVTSAMLLGHWYLVQPGLARGPLLQMLRVAGVLWLPETLVMLWPTGMVSVLNGTIDDGYNGLLGWFWVGCVLLTLALLVVARAALRERQYSAVMAATGLIYLAIVTAAGQDLVARILLTP